MDSQGVKSTCLHLNTINECRTKIVKIEQEKESIKKSIDTLFDVIEEIGEFVFDYDDNIPEILFEPIRSKQEDVRDERRELYKQIQELNKKLTELQEEIAEIEICAKKSHCLCMLRIEWNMIINYDVLKPFD